MQDEKSRPGGIPTKEDAERDATSKETVSDLKKSGDAERTETGNSSDSSGGSAAPSPDGQFDEPRGGAGPGEEAGPM